MGSLVSLGIDGQRDATVTRARLILDRHFPDGRLIRPSGDAAYLRRWRSGRSLAAFGGRESGFRSRSIPGRPHLAHRRAIPHRSGRTPPVGSLRRFAPLPSTRHRRPWPEVVDSRQQVPEQNARHRHLGHLEDGVAGMRDHLGADLHHLLPDGGQRPTRHLVRQSQGPQEVGEVVGQRVSCRRTALAFIAWQDSRVHLAAFLPSLIHCSAVPRWL